MFIVQSHFSDSEHTGHVVVRQVRHSGVDNAIPNPYSERQLRNPNNKEVLGCSTPVTRPSRPRPS